MGLTPLYDPAQGPLRVAGFMSGQGSTLCRILEYETDDYEVAVVFTEKPQSNAKAIADAHGVPFLGRDLKGFYAERGCSSRDLEARKVFDAETAQAISEYSIDVIAYAGYESITTSPLVNGFLGVNCHPADLTVLDEGGNPRYAGGIRWQAVAKALRDGQGEIRATTHLVCEEVDAGAVLMVSAPVPVDRVTWPMLDEARIDLAAVDHQTQLKREGDHIIFPLTLEYIAQGRIAKGKTGNMYFDGRPIPRGIRLEGHND